MACEGWTEVVEPVPEVQYPHGENPVEGYIGGQELPCNHCIATALFDVALSHVAEYECEDNYCDLPPVVVLPVML